MPFPNREADAAVRNSPQIRLPHAHAALLTCGRATGQPPEKMFPALILRIQSFRVVHFFDEEYLTLRGRESKYKCAGQRVLASISGPRHKVEEVMVLCPECESDLDVEENELDEGEILSCTECGSDFEVVGVEPLELTKVSDEVIDDVEEDAKELDEESDF